MASQDLAGSGPQVGRGWKGLKFHLPCFGFQQRLLRLAMSMVAFAVEAPFASARKHHLYNEKTVVPG